MRWILLLVVISALEVVKGNNSCELIPDESMFNRLAEDLRIFRVDLNLDLPDVDSVTTNSSEYIGIRFKPNRWFLLRGERSNRLLLLFYYYYNFFEKIISVSSHSMSLDVTQNPANCLTSLSENERDLVIRRSLVNASKVPSESVVGPIEEVCAMFIREENRFGVLKYHCCKLSDVTNCYGVEEDVWVWILRVFIIIITVFLFFYFPNLIPRRYTRFVYNLTPCEPTELRVVRTRDPEKYAVSGQVVHSAIFNQMTKLMDGLRSTREDIVYKAEVKSLDIFLQRDQMLSETDQSLNFFQLFYAYVLRCKIRNVDAVRQCCNGPICGTQFTTSRQAWPWWKFLDGLKTVVLYLVAAVPSLPLLYSLAADDLQYMQLASKLNKHGLLQTSSYYIGEIAGKVVVAVLTLLYVVHILIVILARNLHEELSNLMEDTVIELEQTRQPVTRKISLTLFRPLNRFGVIFLPIFIVGVLLSPAIALVYLLVTSPVAKLIWRQCTRFCCLERLRYKKYTNPTICGPKITFCLFLTLLSVFVILSIGANFLLHLVCIIVVNMLVNISTYLAAISLSILILVYIRDTSNRLTTKYDSFHKALLAEVLKAKQEEVAAEAKKTDVVQLNTVFQFQSKDFSLDPEVDSSVPVPVQEQTWDVKHGFLRMRTNATVLFLDKYDIPYIPHKFFREMTVVQCSGCPGSVKSSILSSLRGLGKIGLFLLFLFILVLAYGDTVYVSPTSKLFATVATGLIPLFLRSFFFNTPTDPALDTSTLRFRNLFYDKVLSFHKKWPIADFSVTLTKVGGRTLPKLDTRPEVRLNSSSDVELVARDLEVKGNGPEVPPGSGKPMVDLVFDLTGGEFVEVGEVAEVV